MKLLSLSSKECCGGLMVKFVWTCLLVRHLGMELVDHTEHFEDQVVFLISSTRSHSHQKREVLVFP